MKAFYSRDGLRVFRPIDAAPKVGAMYGLEQSRQCRTTPADGANGAPNTSKKSALAIRFAAFGGRKQSYRAGNAQRFSYGSTAARNIALHAWREWLERKQSYRAGNVALNFFPITGHRSIAMPADFLRARCVAKLSSPLADIQRGKSFVRANAETTHGEATNRRTWLPTAGAKLEPTTNGTARSTARRLSASGGRRSLSETPLLVRNAARWAADSTRTTFSLTANTPSYASRSVMGAPFAWPATKTRPPMDGAGTGSRCAADAIAARRLRDGEPKRAPRTRAKARAEVTL